MFGEFIITIILYIIMFLFLFIIMYGILELYSYLVDPPISIFIGLKNKSSLKRFVSFWNW